MTVGVFDFKAIKRKLDCREQKADFDAKNPLPDPNKVVWTPEWGYGVPLTSQAHPEWPYTGTPHEWRNVKT